MQSIQGGFASRRVMLLSMIGIAIGTGNIWRFPRIAAKYEGGAFLIPWLIFLFLWSIPIILIEYAMGKGTRMGTIGAFGKLLGPRLAWMGTFVRSEKEDRPGFLSFCGRIVSSFSD